MDADHHHITRPLRRPHPAGDLVGRGVRQIGQQVDAGPARRSGPACRDPARTRPAREDDHAPAAGHRDGHRPPGLTGVASRTHRPQPGTGQGGQRVRQPPAAEVERVVVRQRARAGPGRGHAGKVTRAHPVVNGPARREGAAAGDARLQVDHPHIGGEIIEYPQGIPPGPGEAGRPRNRATGPLRQADVRPRVARVPLPQFQVPRVRENLVDAAASHHIAAQEHGHQPVAHIDHSARPPAQGPASDTDQTHGHRPGVGHAPLPDLHVDRPQHPPGVGGDERGGQHTNGSAL